MNLRILKKLSKRAAAIIVALGDNREQFRAELNENYLKTARVERKHFERMRSPHATVRDGGIKRPARDGHGGYISMWPPDHPRKGTIMVGAVSGYYEPEWDEETAWDALRNLVWWSFVDYSNEQLKPTRRLRLPSQIFAAAAELLELANGERSS